MNSLKIVHPDDLYILKKIQNPESQNHGFYLLVNKYQKKVYYHIRRMVIDHDDANDLTQNTFIKAWKSINNFREESNIFTWLYRIATNETLNFLNSKKKKFFLPIHDVEKELSNKLVCSEMVESDEIMLKFQKALLTLPEKQKIVFNMKYNDEIKYEEMSEILETSVGALKASYHHAVNKIKKYIENN